MAVRVAHRPAGIFLRPAARPTYHLGHEILEAGRRHFVMGFVDCGIRIQTRIGHDAVDEIVHYDGNVVNSPEALVEAELSG